MFQLSFEDLELSNSLEQQPGRTAFIDECGNFGFNFEESGTSLFYIVCAVIVKNDNIRTLETEIDKIRQNNGFQSGEMKSSSISNNHKRRVKIITELLLQDFHLIVLIADKKAFLQASPLTEYKNSFVKFLHQKLYDSMYEAYPKLKIIEDECSNEEFQHSFREYVMEHRPQENLFNEYDFDYINSKFSPIVQIADIVAGSIMWHIKDSAAPDALSIFHGRIRGIIEFPNIHPPCFAGKDAVNNFNTNIYDLACRCASNYIDEHRDSEEIDIRLRILFLKRLLFIVRNINAIKFVSSAEIIRYLSDLSESKIHRDYLYRKIIAPLRDAGVILASSSQGYKIPTCIDDINAYANQTNGIVGPMLSRVGKCRDLIRKQTDSALDIFDDPALTKYKKYFGDY